MHKFLKRLNTPAPWWAWLLAVLLIPASITATPVLYTGSISVPTGGTFSSKATVVAYNNVQFRDTSNAAVTANGDLVLGLAGNAQGAPYFGCAGTAQNCTLNFYANGTGSVANEVFTPTSAYAVNGAQWRATPGNTLNLAGDFVAGVSSTNQEYVGCTGTANPCTVAFYTNGTGSTSTASISGSNGAIFSASLAASQCVGTNASSILATTGSACLASNVNNAFTVTQTAAGGLMPPCYTSSGAACVIHITAGSFATNFATCVAGPNTFCGTSGAVALSGNSAFSAVPFCLTLWTDPTVIPIGLTGAATGSSLAFAAENNATTVKTGNAVTVNYFCWGN